RENTKRVFHSRGEQEGVDRYGTAPVGNVPVSLAAILFRIALPKCWRNEYDLHSAVGGRLLRTSAAQTSISGYRGSESLIQSPGNWLYIALLLATSTRPGLGQAVPMPGTADSSALAVLFADACRVYALIYV